jgi:hypothetical protein
MSKFNGVRKLRNECENWIDNLWCQSVSDYVSRLVAYIIKLERELAEQDGKIYILEHVQKRQQEIINELRERLQLKKMGGPHHMALPSTPSHQGIMTMANSIIKKMRRSKLAHLFHPMPIGIRYEFIDTERRASNIERYYWVMEQLTMDNYMSVRHVSKKCKCSRYQAEQTLKECKKLLGLEPDTNQTPFRQQKQACELRVVDNQTPTRQEPDTINKNNKLINYKLKKPLGKRCKAELITKEVADVWNFWYELNPTARSVNGEDARCIRTALKSGYSVDDLIQICRWAHLSDDYQWQRDKGFTRCRNFLNGEKIDGNHEKAQEFKESKRRPNPPNKTFSVRDVPDTLLDRRYGAKGHLLPEHGGVFRPGGDY